MQLLPLSALVHGMTVDTVVWELNSHPSIEIPAFENRPRHLAVLDHHDFESFDLPSLRTGVAAGSPCPPAMMLRMINEINLRNITIGYGMTETSPLSTQTRPRASLETRADTVGQMLPHFEGD